MIVEKKIEKNVKNPVRDIQPPSATLSFRLILIVFQCSIGFVLMGTHIGWTSQFFKIFTKNGYLSLTELIIISSVLPLGALIGLIVAVALNTCLKFKSILVMSSLVGTCVSMYAAQLPYIMSLVEVYDLPVTHNFYYHLIGVRMVVGIVIGILYQVIPIYCRQIIPAAKIKGVENFFSFQLALGIFMQYATALFTDSYYMEICAGVTVVFFVCTIFLPFSSNHLKLSKIIKESSNGIENFVQNYLDALVPQPPKLRLFRDFDDVSTDESITVSSSDDDDDIRLCEINLSTALPIYTLTLFLQATGGYSIFFYLWKILEVVESDYSPEIVAASTCGSLLISLGVYKLFRLNRYNSKSVLLWSFVLMLLTVIVFGTYCHIQGATMKLPTHGYIPLVCFILYALFYGLGPYHVITNYFHAVTNERNIFKVRLIYSTCTWFTVLILLIAIPLLVKYIGPGWISFYSGFMCIASYWFVTTFLPNLGLTVIDTR